MTWDDADGGPTTHLPYDRAARELEASGMIEVKFLNRVAFAAKITDVGRRTVEQQARSPRPDGQGPA
jgi:hypothetical protein